MARRIALALAAAAGIALLAVPSAPADLADEQALADRFAPAVRLVEQEEECGPGEPYDPLDVDLLLDNEPTVALRGPWTATDLVKIGPRAKDLRNRYEYHLDFPGNALDPGCTYERWSRRLAEGSEPKVYAHVATEAGRPGKLALQYWLFYAFNDFNNTHEGDWEMIQLLFDADDTGEALGQEPVEVGYSSHEGAERAEWGDEKLDVVDETHPVVYPAAGSHANKFTEALYLGSSAEAGVGCDDTRGPHREVRPTVATIPSDAAAAVAAFPWIDFEGRWGELQKAFFNGPTGPNLKTQWTQPITWSEDWRDRSYAVPTGGLFGTGATDFFCGAVERGSRGLVLLLRNPALVALLLAILVGLITFVVVRPTWTPVAPRRLGRRRTWGQILSASASMYVRHPLVFLGIGLLVIPISFVTAVLQWILLEGLDAIGFVTTGEIGGRLGVPRLVIGTTLALLALGLVQAATVCALLELDAEKTRPRGQGVRERTSARRAFARRQRRLRAWLDRPERDVRPDPRRDLARDPLVPPRARRDTRGGSPGARAPPQPRPRASALAADGVARRGQRGDLAEPRAASGRAAHLRRGRTARAAQPRGRHRLRGSAPVRRAGHRLRVLRCAYARRAGTGRRRARAAGRNRARPRLDRERPSPRQR